MKLTQEFASDIISFQNHILLPLVADWRQSIGYQVIWQQGARPPTKIDCKQKRRNLKRSNLTQHSSKDSFLSNYGHSPQIRPDSAVASFCLKNLVLQSRNMISWHMIHICRYAYMHICTRYTSMHVHMIHMHIIITSCYHLKSNFYNLSEKEGGGGHYIGG